MKSRLFLILLLTFFFKEIVWLTIIPLWHFPDEEQHFGEVAFYAEKGRFPQGKEFDVNQEIDKSSVLLGTKRDERGNNKFTYHPEYRIPYTKSKIGFYEDEISKLNILNNRQKMVKREAARYGPIYYILSAIPYKIFNQNDLLVRVFSSRLISVLLSTLTIFITYLIAKELFRSELLSLSLVFLIAFQPMFSFVSAGINSDNLFNLIFSTILFCLLKIFFPHTRSSCKDLPCRQAGRFFTFVLITGAILAGLYTKKQIIICLPIIFLGFLISLVKKSGKNKIKRLIVVIATLLVLAYLFKDRLVIPEYSPLIPSKLKESFFQYIFWHFKHTVAETIPWYWGVFNWLGVTLPRWFNRIQSRILVVSAIGIIVYFYKVIKNKKILTTNNLRIIFLLGAALVYYFSLICWDYFFRQSQGFSFGIQGRYFFPTTASHMLFILLGIISLVPKNLKILTCKILNLWWVFFSFVGLYTAAAAYYKLWPLATFLNQVSQYKPPIFKAFTLAIFFILFSISLFIYLLKLFSLNERKN